VFHAISVPFEELLFTFDEEDDSDFAEELLSASDDEDAIVLEELVSSPRELEELEAISELLEGCSEELEEIPAPFFEHRA
jgi:hypothetical protein